MNPSNHNPENFSRIFSQYVRALVQFLISATIGLTAVAGAYIALRAVLVGVNIVLRALGI